MIEESMCLRILRLTGLSSSLLRISAHFVLGRAVNAATQDMSSSSVRGKCTIIGSVTNYTGLNVPHKHPLTSSYLRLVQQFSPVES